MRCKRVVSLLAAMLVIGYIGISHAQGDKPQPIYSGESLAYLDWSANGRDLLFTDAGSVAKSIHQNEPEKWQSYNPNAELLTQSTFSPFRTAMTDALGKALRPSADSEYPTTTPISYLSPNGRYLTVIASLVQNTRASAGS